MGNVKRVYVEKKPEYAVQAKDLYHELHGYLGIKDLKNVRVLIRYDVENITDETFEKACNGIFSEPPVDTLYKEEFPMAEGSRVFSVEFLPGQFDQRADSAVQCVQFIKEDEQPVIHTATTYVVEGNLTDEEFEAVKKHCINPVDSRETGMEKPDTLVTKFEEPEDVRIFDGFKEAGISLGGLTEQMMRFPLASLGVGWLIPAFVGFLIGVSPIGRKIGDSLRARSAKKTQAK